MARNAVSIIDFHRLKHCRSVKGMKTRSGRILTRNNYMYDCIYFRICFIILYLGKYKETIIEIFNLYKYCIFSRLYGDHFSSSRRFAGSGLKLIRILFPPVGSARREGNDPLLPEQKHEAKEDFSPVGPIVREIIWLK